jgi:hypothetical protein
MTREVIQRDYATILDDGPELLPNGFLPVNANLTRTGIFTYFEMSPDGTIKVMRQLRHPDEVFSEESLSTLQGLPATNDHPPVALLTTGNAKDYVVGWQAENPRRVYMPESTADSEEYIQTKVVFFDKPTIDAIVSGRKKEISLGYTCVLDETPGEWNGQKYDAIQRGIRYNHLSLVDKARGGPACRIIADSNDISLNAVVDGFSLVAEEMEMDKTQLDAMEKELNTLKVQRDRLQAELDETKEKLKTAIFADAQGFSEAVKKRVALEKKAQSILGDKVELKDSTEMDIMKQVILHLRPGIQLDGKSDEYIQARFEISCEDSQSMPKAPVKRQSEEKLGTSVLDGQSDDWTSVAAKARQKMMENARNAYKV